MENIIKTVKYVYQISKTNLNLILAEYVKNEHGDIVTVQDIENDADSTFYNIVIQ